MLAHGVGAYNEHAFLAYEQTPDNVVRSGFGSREGGLHVAQKPIRLLGALIELTTLEDQLVLDPFCGSGSTLVAAKNLGRRYLGFDISEEYVDIARERLRPDMFEAAKETKRKGGTNCSLANNAMPKNPLKSPDLFINRELSWLEFNHRVLQEGLDADLPLLERLKFLAIVGSNLDEFFLVRVAWLMQRRAAKVRRRDVSGMTPAEQLAAISRRVHQMVEEQSAGVREVFARLAEHGLRVWNREQWTEEHRRFAEAYFAREIEPILTPLAIQELTPSPLLPNLQLHVAGLLGEANGIAAEPSPGRDTRVVVVPVPSQLPRWVTLPSESETHLARVEDVIAANLGAMFPGSEVAATAAFRISRDADVVLQDDEEIDDLLHAMEEVVLSRRWRTPVRLTISAEPDPRLRKWLADWLKLGDEAVYEVDGPLEASALMELVEPARVRRPEDRRLAAAGSARLDRRRRSLASGPGPRRAAVSSLRELRSGGEAGGAGGRRSADAGDQADALPHQRRFADHSGVGPRRPKRQGSRSRWSN